MNVLNSTQIKDFLDMFMVNSMYPIIHFSTRITNNTSTLLDNMFTNNLNHMFTGVLVADISDHLPIFCISQKQVVNKNNQVDFEYTFRKRDLCEANIIHFVDKISKVKWIVPNKNADHGYNCFLQQFLECYNECFSIKDIKSRKTLQKKTLVHKGTS